MPVFNFEKAVRRDSPVPVDSAETESRGMIIRLLDQIAEARMQRDVRSFCRITRGKKQDVHHPPGQQHR